ncbi:LOB domain-containing protein 13 [Apostasia shenzhenica]|uniref:LOB domain-containing protein 13 n=1 Tax=Apostasia shenzhenica TaxID=1088818 RepID=A0A2I0AFR8_9ASPA|nr:LOB domain-containing protein 13 [Apostasia shenzhenica]
MTAAQEWADTADGIWIEGDSAITIADLHQTARGHPPDKTMAQIANLFCAFKAYKISHVYRAANRATDFVASFSCLDDLEWPQQKDRRASLAMINLQSFQIRLILSSPSRPLSNHMRTHLPEIVARRRHIFPASASLMAKGQLPPAPMPATETTTVRQACAACKKQRKKCEKQCKLAKLFSPEQGADFDAVHRVFGLKNLMAMLERVEGGDELKRAARDAIVWEARQRLFDPVNGSFGLLAKMQTQLVELRRENSMLRGQIMMMQHMPCSGQIGICHCRKDEGPTATAGVDRFLSKAMAPTLD